MPSHGRGTVRLRAATMDDAALLLAWANDPSTRAASFRTEAIPVDEHVRWLAERLASPSTRLLVGLSDERSIGMIRLEEKPGGVVEIGISVASQERGRGLGRVLLEAGLEAARTDAALDARVFLARVRVDNAASIRLFEGAGFRLREQGTCDAVPCLVFELDR